MSTQSAHPSYLELDCAALGAAREAGTAEHLRVCERCRSYVEAARPADVVPGWVTELGRAPARRARPLGWLAGGLAAAAVLLLVWMRPESEPLYVGTKGSPSALVYVHRDDTTMLWDQTPLRAGDRIRLEVAPEEFEHVTVLGGSARGAESALLFSGHVEPRQRALLPKAWQLDGVGQAEHLAVVFSHAELSAGAARALLRARDPAEVQIVRLTLPKQ
jgi:hypothetical protein